MGLLDGKVVLITGAGGGIGRAHALACAREGARVVVNDLGGARDGSGGGHAMADEVVATIQGFGGEAVASYGSVTVERDCETMVQAALDTWGRLDAVVNNAGILQDRTFAKMSTEAWDRVVDVHLTGTRNVIRAALPSLAVQGGSIINTTSSSGLLGNFGQSNYGAAKAGIYGLSQVLAMELRKKGITVNCVAPVAHTRMTEDIPMVDAAWGPEHIAPIVVFLASDLAREVTGQVFGVQGQRIHAYRMQTSAGCTRPGSSPWTAHAIARHLDAILDFDHLAPALAATDVGAPVPLGPLGKRYDGGTWTLTRQQTVAYALATDDPNPRYLADEPVAPPMFHVLPMLDALMGQMARDPELGLDMLRLVHGEHDMRFHRLLRPGETLAMAGELIACDEKASGLVTAFRLEGTVDGELVIEGRTSYFIRGTGGGGAKAPRAPAEAPPPPDLEVAQQVALDQTERYAVASGDHNPIHLDEAVARAAGLPGRINHGLCTMAFAQRDLVDQLAGGDPGRLARLGVRFSRPVLLGERLLLKAWGLGGTVRFVVENADGKPVITNGIAEIR